MDVDRELISDWLSEMICVQKAQTTVFMSGAETEVSYSVNNSNFCVSVYGLDEEDSKTKAAELVLLRTAQLISHRLKLLLYQMIDFCFD